MSCTNFARRLVWIADAERDLAHIRKQAEPGDADAAFIISMLEGAVLRARRDVGEQVVSGLDPSAVA
jgi:hypothetical protein